VGYRIDGIVGDVDFWTVGRVVVRLRFTHCSHQCLKISFPLDIGSGSFADEGLAVELWRPDKADGPGT